MRVQVKPAFTARINKLATTKQYIERSWVNPVVEYASPEHLQSLLESIQRYHEEQPLDAARGGYLIVPKLLPVDDWEALAVVSQAKLCSEAR